MGRDVGLGRQFRTTRREQIEQEAKPFYQLRPSVENVPGETLVERKTRLDQAEAEYPQAAAELSKICWRRSLLS